MCLDKDLREIDTNKDKEKRNLADKFIYYVSIYHKIEKKERVNKVMIGWRNLVVVVVNYFEDSKTP